MATIVNARDVKLQAASPRVQNMNLPSNIAIPGATLINSVAASTVVSNAANGNSAYSALGNKLDNNAANVIQSGFYLKTTNYDSGTGVAIYNSGIVLKSGGVNTVVLNSSGTASYAGDISTAGSVAAYGTTSYGGYSAAIRADASSGYAFMGTTSTGIGAYGYATGASGIGLYGAASNASGTGVSGYGSNGATGVVAYSDSGNALYCNGKMAMTNSTLVSNLNADKVQGQSSNLIYYNGTTTPASPGVIAGYLQFKTISGSSVAVAYYT